MNINNKKSIILTTLCSILFYAFLRYFAHINLFLMTCHSIGMLISTLARSSNVNFGDTTVCHWSVNKLRQVQSGIIKQRRRIGQGAKLPLVYVARGVHYITLHSLATHYSPSRQSCNFIVFHFHLVNGRGFSQFANMPNMSRPLMWQLGCAIK